MLARVLISALLATAVIFSSSRSHAYHDAESPWIKGSAYTLRKGELSIGLLEAGAGITDHVMVSTYWPLWFAGPVLGGPIPNLSFKGRDWIDGPLTVSLAGSFLFLDGTKVLERVRGSESKAGLLTVSTTLAASYRASDQFTSSLELTFSKAALVGDDQDASLGGAAVMDSLRLGATAEWRLSRLFAAQVKARTLLYRDEPSLQANFRPDAWTEVHAELAIEKLAPTLASSAMAGVVMSGKNVNAGLLAGYGYAWIPLIDLAWPKPGFVGEFDFFVRF